MNLTTTVITGLAISVFTVALTMRATQSRPARAADGWRALPPIPETLPIRRDVAVPLHDLERTYERALTKDDRAKGEAAEALDDMRHAHERLASPDTGDEPERAHWQHAYRTANLRFAEASHERRKALQAMDHVRGRLQKICANVEPAAP